MLYFLDIVPASKTPTADEEQNSHVCEVISAQLGGREPSEGPVLVFDETKSPYTRKQLKVMRVETYCK